MIGVVIVTHGALAVELINAAQHVVGTLSGWASVGIGPDDELDQGRAAVRDAVNRADQGHGVLVLTDVFGGTPANLAVTMMESGRVEVLSGVNLPMLITLAQLRENGPNDLRELAEAVVHAGKKYVALARHKPTGACP